MNVFRFVVFLHFLKRKILQVYSQRVSVSCLQYAGVNFRKESIRFIGRPILRFSSGNNVIIGQHFTCISGQDYPIDNTLCSKIVVRPNASLCIGNNVGMSNTCIQCYKSITIGDHVNIGAGTMIMDTDFHSLDWKDRQDGTDTKSDKVNCAPILIKNFAFIGARCMILKGVTIGEKSIVGAGSIVTKSIPDGEIWGGSPARFIKKIN